MVFCHISRAGEIWPSEGAEKLLRQRRVFVFATAASDVGHVNAAWHRVQTEGGTKSATGQTKKNGKHHGFQTSWLSVTCVKSIEAACHAFCCQCVLEPQRSSDERVAGFAGSGASQASVSEYVEM